MGSIALTLVVGLGIGVVVGALGAGGGILAVPVLVYLLGQPPHDATTESLVIVGITAVFAIIHHARAGTVVWGRGLVFALVSVAGAVAGSRVSVLVAPDVLMVLFALLLAVVAAVMIRRALRARRGERGEGGRRSAADGPGVPAADGAGSAAADVPGAATVRSWPRLVLAALLTGALTGFFGVGGGFIVVPMLVIVLGLGMRDAAGTSLLVMIIATGGSLLARIGTDVHPDWGVTLVFAAASSVGAMIGGPLSARARPSTLTWLFALLLAGVALSTLIATLGGGR